MAGGRAALLLAALATCAAADGGGDAAQPVQCEGADEGTCYKSEDDSALFQYKARVSSGDQDYPSPLGDPAHPTRTVYIMRHAERLTPLSCLNECGWHRALAYQGIFQKFLGNDTKPDIYSFDYGSYGDIPFGLKSCQRTSQTASWVAWNYYGSNFDKGNIKYITCGPAATNDYNESLLEVNAEPDPKHPCDPFDHKGHAYGQDWKMAQHTKQKMEDPNGDGQHMLIFWEHTNIECLVLQMTGENVVWPMDTKQYDYFIKIDYEWQGGGYHHVKGIVPSTFNVSTGSLCPSCHAWSKEAGCAWKSAPQRTGINLGNHTCYKPAGNPPYPIT